MIDGPDPEVLMRKLVPVLLILVLTVAQVASAVITFEQLDGNTFTVSHQVKWIGGRGQAMQVVYEKVASLCVAAGFTHYQIVDQASHAGGGYQAANATVTVKFFLEGAEDRVECGVRATEEYVKQAQAKLEKRGYEGPPAADVHEGSAAEENHCTVEQIAAMVKAGLTEAQIKAACAEEE
jgi:hypothetical protein